MKLYLTQALVTIRQKIKIEDDRGKLRYTVKSGLIDIKDKTIIENAEGEFVARVERKPISAHEAHKIEMASGKKLEIAAKLIRIGNDNFKIHGNDWTVKGNIFEHDYKIKNASGVTIARVHKKWISVREVYVIDIEDEKRMNTIVAIVIAMEHIIQDRITKEKKERKAKAR